VQKEVGREKHRRGAKHEQVYGGVHAHITAVVGRGKRGKGGLNQKKRQSPTAKVKWGQTFPEVPPTKLELKENRENNSHGARNHCGKKEIKKFGEGRVRGAGRQGKGSLGKEIVYQLAHPKETLDHTGHS